VDEERSGATRATRWVDGYTLIPFQAAKVS
jgi:hypothetical protein